MPDFLKGCCNTENSAPPHLSETAVGDITEKESVSKAVAAARTTGRERSVGKKGKKDD